MRKIDYKKFRNFQDIEIAKARVRYEMLLAENHLYETIMRVERIFTLTSFISRFATGFSHAQGAYGRITDLFGKIFRRKSKKAPPSAGEHEG